MEFLEGYEAIAATRIFFENYRHAQTRCSGQTPPRLNVWSEPDLLRSDEVSLCRVLKWFLDPISLHDRGDHFLTSFLDRFLQPRRPLRYGALRVQVHREYRRADHRIDIAIESSTDFIGIEAKVESPEDLEQLRGYSDTFSAGRRFQGLFLTKAEASLSEQALATVGFRRILWSDVAEWLEEESSLLAGQALTSRHLAGFLAGNFAQAIKAIYGRKRT